MTDPTPTPTAPDWRELCQELRDAYFRSEDYPGNDPRSIELIVRADAALAQPERTGDHIARLEAELERERLRLAACGVVVMADTPESAAKARDMHPDCWSASLDDVIRQVDALMAARAALAAIQPVPVSEQPWERDGWCDEYGRCCCFAKGRNWRSDDSVNPSEYSWMLRCPEPGRYDTHFLPHWAFPLPVTD